MYIDISDWSFPRAALRRICYIHTSMNFHPLLTLLFSDKETQSKLQAQDTSDLRRHELSDGLISDPDVLGVQPTYFLSDQWLVLRLRSD
jgi:hypothetical protein